MCGNFGCLVAADDARIKNAGVDYAPLVLQRMW
jgi:hypothetical protein